jgi:threonine/homoserine/homoserine lactone efflux protein
MIPSEYALYVFFMCSAILTAPGPIFFLSINESIRGLRRGLLMLFGVLAAESVLLILIDVEFVFLLQRFLGILRVAGAVLMVGLAVSAMHEGVKGVSPYGRKMIGAPYIRGFLVTLVNPPLILWFVTVGSVLLETGVETVGNLAYVIFGVSLLGVSAIVALAIILSIQRGKRVIGPRGLRILSFISGGAFVIMAILLVIPLL